jgi:hypothetical protein
MAIEPIRPVDRLDGGARVHAIQARECTFCGGPATEFRDEQERKEYAISGACSPCQSAFFALISHEFTIESDTTTVTIAVDIKQDGAAVIEAFAYDEEADETYDIGIWSVDAEARLHVGPAVITAVKQWCTLYKVVLDDKVTATPLVFADLLTFLRTSALP